MNKEQHWQQLVNHFELTTDNLGKPLDSGIFDTVVALNAFDFETTGSCEGHTAGSYAPYIDIAVTIPASEKEQLLQMLKSAKIDEELRAANDFAEEISVRYLEIRRRLMALLTDFYWERHVPYGQLLTLLPCRDVFGLVEGIRLQCMGTEDLDISNEAERVVKLKAYQGEVQDFTVFLKDKYFQETFKEEMRR